MDLISIIIPYYKKKKYIKPTILSILKQSYQKFEVIIIYDDSCKGRVKIFKKFN